MVVVVVIVVSKGYARLGNSCSCEDWNPQTETGTEIETVDKLPTQRVQF